MKVLCWVMTMKENHALKARAILHTWGPRCNKLIFMSDAYDPELRSIKIDTIPGRSHLTAKTMKAFGYLYEHELEHYDWFLKADDDTYVVVENLRFLLMNYSRNQAIFFGYHFNMFLKQGYFSGGGGYVISREALRRFGTRQPQTCINDGGAEDVQFARCMQALNVRAGDSRDALGRERFHCLGPNSFIHGKFPKWLKSFAMYPPMSVSIGSKLSRKCNVVRIGILKAI